MNQGLSFALRCVIKAIKLYQHTASPDHGWLKFLFPAGVCRFEPTCSQYAIEALQKYHWSGVVMAAKRLLRCHPFHTGGYDPVIHNS